MSADLICAVGRISFAVVGRMGDKPDCTIEFLVFLFGGHFGLSRVELCIV